jgi:chaperonin GroEL
MVPGGGVALLNAVEALDEVERGLEGDILTGIKILRKALPEPMSMLAENAGYDGAVVVENVKREQKVNNNKRIGFDVMAEDYGDMVSKQIIDPAKVTRGGLENAASIAAMILTTECLITDIPEKEKPAPAAPPPEY